MYKEVKELYDALADEESKEIFRLIFLHSLTGKWKHFKEMLIYCQDKCPKQGGYKSLVDVLKDSTILQDKKIVLFGTGVWGSPVKQLLKREGIGVDYYCDNDRSKTGTIFCGKLILSVEELMAKHKDAVVVVSTDKYEEEILKQLEELGFPKEQVIRLKFTDREIYFDNEIVSPQENEIFVDGGCYDGETSLDFIKWTNGKVKKIYAFEPDTENCKLCEKNLTENTDIPCHLEKSGLWSCRTELKFIAEHSVGSRLYETGTISVPVNSIDNVVKEEDKVTFIKMDIEGAELEALKGAAKTIQRCKPRMAICLYHKSEDILDIPLYVHKLLPEYTLYIRHYIPYYFDTVLYAVPKQTCDVQEG